MSQNLTLAALSATNFTDFRAAVTPGGIEAQEAAGQAIFVSNATLPKDCNRDMLALMGVKFGADVDDLFVMAQLPDGWKKQATEHSMWSDLLDENGRKRASIFYKAAFYDRKAHMNLCRRYIADAHESCDADGTAVEYGKHTHVKTVVKDCADIIHTIGIREADDYQTGDEHRVLAETWLDVHYPDWHNPLAYW